jgi:hypothetical protein
MFPPELPMLMAKKNQQPDESFPRTSPPNFRRGMVKDGNINANRRFPRATAIAAARNTTTQVLDRHGNRYPKTKPNPPTQRENTK